MQKYMKKSICKYGKQNMVCEMNATLLGYIIAKWISWMLLNIIHWYSWLLFYSFFINDLYLSHNAMVSGLLNVIIFIIIYEKHKLDEWLLIFDV